MSQKIKIISILLLVFCTTFFSEAQENKSGYQFNMVKQLKTTPVKNQQSTGTCWSFATTSYIETELLRMGKPEYDLSEMFFVRYAYPEKVKQFVRYQGANNFGEGGQAHDVFNVMRKYGIATEESYNGKNYGLNYHNHAELVGVLKGMLDAVVKNENGKLSTAWLPAFESVLDAYLGKVPRDILVSGNIYNPKSFFESTGFKPDDYVEITSFNHHPFYKKIILEIPDNWAHDLYYNIPLDELMQIIDFAINKGYSVCWDGDVSEKGFAHNKGFAILPASKIEEIAGSEKAKWATLTENELKTQMYAFNGPVPEQAVNQQNRQDNFDNLTSTDDHLMHITGIATDQNGTKYYFTKNSWGTTDHIYNGFLYMSESYVRMKTIAIMIHKEAIPREIASKLGL